MNLIKVNLADKEHSWMAKIRKHSIPLVAGTNKYPLKSIFSESTVKSDAYALAFRRQSRESLSTPPTLVKRTHMGSGVFKDLCNLPAFMSAAIEAKDNDGNEIIHMQISHAGYDNLDHSPGEYLQMILVDGFDRDQSFIWIDDSLIVAGEVLEIVYLSVTDENCKVEKTCS